MKPIVLWVMLVFNSHAPDMHPNPYVMGTWQDGENGSQATCERNTKNWNEHHLSYVQAECLKYTADLAEREK